MREFPWRTAQRPRTPPRRARITGWALPLSVCALAFPLSPHAGERSAPMNAEARAWLGRSCPPQGCAAPRTSAGMPLGFAGAVLVAAAMARRRDARLEQNDDR